MNRKIFLLFIVLFLGIVATATLIIKINHPQNIPIGVALNLSGHGAARGQTLKEGIIVAVKELNQYGGINGKHLNLFIEDDQNTKEGVISADKRLLERQCPVIIGHNTSKNTLTAYPLIVGNGKILISSCTTTTALSGKDDFFFRTSVDNALFAKAWAKILKDNDIHSITLLIDMSNREFSKDLGKQIGHYFDGEIQEAVINTNKNVDWNGTITPIIYKKSHAVILITNPKDTAIALQKLRALGYSGNIYATAWAQGQELLSYGGKSVEGLKLVSFAPPLPKSAYEKINLLMQKYFHKEATIGSAVGFELIMILADAMKRCKDLAMDPTCIKRNLLAGQYSPLAETITFDKFGDIKRSIYELEVKNGQFVVSKQIL